jgi:16S rRNA (cytidine1402-2'-O)-methyltransferase
MTMVFYESPHRVIDALEDIESILGDRPVAIARELTKLHEETLRGSAHSIRAALEERASIKGEFVLVIGAAPENDLAADELTIEAAITDALGAMPASKAAATVAKLLHLTRDDIYARILKRKSDGQT